MKFIDRYINPIVYSIGGIWVLTIILNTLSNNFTSTNLLGGLRDISEVAITLFVYWAVDQVRRSKNFIRAAIAALRQLHTDNKDITRFGTKKELATQKAEQYIFFKSKKRETKFIPLDPLKNRILEIYITYGTLENFDYEISPKDNDSDKERKISSAKQFVRERILDHLKRNLGESYYELDTINSKNEIAVRVNFQDKLTPEEFKKVIYECGNETVRILKENRTKK